MQANRRDVESFLTNFRTKLAIFSIVFRDDRGKNIQALLDLEITPNRRYEIIEKLEVSDYSEGPLEDELFKISDMWVFGKEEKGKEIYIKISMGHPNCSTICISFHAAEYKINYPFKTK